MPTLKNIQQIIAAAKAKRPWYDEFWSLAKIVASHASDIGNLSVGSSPDQFAAYDTRFYVVQTGFSSNAYTAALSPVATGEAIPTGYMIQFIPGDTNTGAATLDVGSTDGAVSVKKYVSGAKANLEAGDLVDSVRMPMFFDGTDWIADVPEVLTVLDEDDFASDSETQPPSQQSVAAYVAANAVPISPAKATGLVVESNASNPAYQIDIDADQAVLVNGSGNPVVHSSIDVTVDITASGVDGLDTGTEANSTWYFLWLVSNGTLVKGLLSTSSSSPTMPEGYSYKIYVGAVYNDGSGDFIPFVQVGSKVMCHAAINSMLSGGSATSMTLTSAATAPAHVRWLRMLIHITGGVTAAAEVGIDGTNFYAKFQDTASGDSNKDLRANFEGPCTSALKVYYKKNSGNNVNIDCVGWVDHKVAA